MKFRNFGQASLAILATLAATIGVSACKQNYTIGYFYVTGVKTGTTSGQIGAFKVNSTDGALFTIPGQPFASGGSNPVRVINDLTGRYVYVLNQGVKSTNSSGDISYTGNGLSVLSVGGNGHLAYQQNYSASGVDDLRIAEYSGSYLYVLDKYAPAALPSGKIANASSSYSAAFPCYDSTDNVYRPVGAITAYAVNSTTGVLTLLQNTQQHGITYFPVGCFPVDFHIAGNNVYTMDAGSSSNNDVETVFPYTLTSTGQLTVATNGPQTIPGAVDINTIDGDSAGRYVFMLDAATNTIYEYSPGSNGSLTEAGSAQEAYPNDANVADPDALTVSPGEKFLYVANAQATGSLNSSKGVISYFTINPTTSSLAPDAPYTDGTGSGPVTILIGPTNQFLYTVDHTGGTITGRLYDPNTGTLKDLHVKSTYNTVDQPTWGIIDPHTD